MYVGTCLALPGFSPSTGPALGQTPAAHVVTDDYWGSWRLLLTPGPWDPLEGRKGWFCCSPSFLLSVESPLGHFFLNAQALRRHRLKVQKASCLKNLRAQGVPLLNK